MKVKITFLFFVLPLVALSQLAFPSALGFGKNITGGAGGTLYIVTNLNTSGAGSFHEAITATGPRTIVFNISGNIIYPPSTNINVADGDLTIMGETAPGDGIAIIDAQLTFREGNVIIRHMRFRQTSGSSAIDCFRLRSVNNDGSGPANDGAIIDHCSCSWGTDENISNADFSNVTLQYCLLGDPEGAGSILFGSDVSNFTLIRNLLVWSSFRNPIVTTTKAEYQWINNMVYGHTDGMQNAYGTWVDVIGNIWENDTNAEASTIDLIPGDNGGVLSDTRIYHSDNIYEGGPANVDSDYDGPGTTFGSPQFNSGAPVINSSLVEALLLANVGARRNIGNGLDSYDQSLISDVQNNVSSNYRNPFTISLTNESWPASYDTDNDGIEDAWEITYLGDLTQGANDDDDNDGYSNLREFSFNLTGEQAGQDIIATPSLGINSNQQLVKSRRQ